MSMLFTTSSPALAFLPTSDFEAAPSSWPRAGARLALSFLLSILVLSPGLALASEPGLGPWPDAVVCDDGPVVFPGEIASDTETRGSTVVALEGPGILELSGTGPEARAEALILRPCTTASGIKTSTESFPGLVLSVDASRRTVWIPRPGRWVVERGEGARSSSPWALRTRFTPWSEHGTVDLLGDLSEVARLTRWSPAAGDQGLDERGGFDKEEDHEVDPDPSTFAPTPGNSPTPDLYQLTLGRRHGSEGFEPLGWILFFGRTLPENTTAFSLATREEDHEVDPDPSVAGPSTVAASTTWSAWVVPTEGSEALWLQWRETQGSSADFEDTAGSRVLTRALDLTRWLDPRVAPEVAVTLVPNRVLPWTLVPSGAAGLAPPALDFQRNASSVIP